MNSALQHRTADQGAGPQSLPSDWELRIGAVSGAGRVVVVPAAGGTLGADPGCTLPITGLRVVHNIATEMAYIRVTQSGLVLDEIAPGLTVADVQRATEAPLIVSPELKTMVV